MFTTAFDGCAVRAFEVNAFDYLLKPVRPGRLASVLDKARTALAATRAVQPERTRSSAERVFLRDGERCWIVQWSEIVLFEARFRCRDVSRQLREILVCEPKPLLRIGYGFLATALLQRPA